MWEHAGALVGIPGSLKALLELFDRVSKHSSSAVSEPVDVRPQIQEIENALSAFATDALELIAYKRLHTITNELAIDFQQVFVLSTPDDRAAESFYNANKLLIALELEATWRGSRAGAQLTELRDASDLLSLIDAGISREVREKAGKRPWHDHFERLMRTASNEVNNFQRFYTVVRDLRGFNDLLNNFANRRLERGINDLDEVLKRLRRELEKGL